MPEPVSFTLDGRTVAAEPGEMLISAADRAGTYIPRFCYHPRMKPVGMCRMCLVEVSGPRGATLQPSCFIPVTEGMEVNTTSDGVKKAQDGVLEFLLINHPLDCPVCDKGGECPLQDQTLAYGPGESRFIEEKRHFEKPIPISDLVLLDRERCIQCARCTRFAEEIAGEAQIDFAGRAEQVEVAIFPDQPFSSYFSGNTVQICPVGALTATPYRFTARPWDLDQVESTCTTCALGCRVAVQSSADRLTRLLGIDSEPVNHGWLCDKGRFVFESVSGATGEPDVAPGVARLTEPMIRRGGHLVEVSWSEALAAAAQGLKDARAMSGPEGVALLGGARCTNEGAYAWARLLKGVLRTDSVDAQLGDGLPADLVLSLPRATIEETCTARTVLLLAGDVREELPVLFLRLREAVLAGETRIVELTPRPTSLTPHATSLTTRPGDAPLLVRALLGDEEAATTLRAHPENTPWSEDDLTRARTWLMEAAPHSAGGAAAGVAGTGAEAGSGSPRGSGIVVVLGRPSLAEHADVIAEAARALAAALPGARFLPALRRGNVLGALDMGLAPGVLPGRVSLESGRDWFGAAWGGVPASKGRDASAILASMASSDGTDRVRALVAVGVDLPGDVPDAGGAAAALGNVEFLVAVTGHSSPLIERADVVLPVAVTHERPGTTTNVEGRVSRLGQKVVAPGSAWPDWMIAAELARELGEDLGFENLGDLWAQVERFAPAYEGITVSMLDEARTRDGVLTPLGARGDASIGSDPIDPVALPGVDSVERQGAPPRVGQSEPTGSGDSSQDPAPSTGTAARPAMLTPEALAPPVRPSVPPVDRYSLRLVSGRRLYDSGRAIETSPSLSELVPTAVVRANPHDLDRLGVTTGGLVRVRSARATMLLPAETDAHVPRGVAAIDFNLPAPVPAGVAPAPAGASGSDATVGNVAAILIDASAMVNDIRLESI